MNIPSFSGKSVITIVSSMPFPVTRPAPKGLLAGFGVVSSSSPSGAPNPSPPIPELVVLSNGALSYEPQASAGASEVPSVDFLDAPFDGSVEAVVKELVVRTGACEPFGFESPFDAATEM